MTNWTTIDDDYEYDNAFDGGEGQEVGGFSRYTVADTTIGEESGRGIIIVTLIFVVTCISILLCMLQLAKRRDATGKECNAANDCLDDSLNSKSTEPSSDLSSNYSTYIATVSNLTTCIVPTVVTTRTKSKIRRCRVKNKRKFVAMETGDTCVEIGHMEINEETSSTVQSEVCNSNDSVRSSSSSSSWTAEFYKILEWDIEMKKMTKLMIPFLVQAISTGLLDIIQMIVIGRLVGTAELIAHVVVHFFLEASEHIVSGFVESLTTLCSQSVGVGNKKLTGQYVQLAMILHTFFFIPIMIFWACYMSVIITALFGFEPEIGRIGQTYALVVMFDYLLDGISECIHVLLDVTDKEKYSTIIGVTQDVTSILVLFLVAAALASSSGDGSQQLRLIDIAFMELGIDILFLLFNIIYIHCRGWFQPYLQGMLGSFALKNNKAAAFLMCKTALSLSIGYLLTEGEWELLGIFASFLGPAEVAAWGIFGTIWSAFEGITEAVGDAAEVRVAILLGSGQPARAKLSAYKSLLIGSYVALVIAAVILICGDTLPSWITDDETLQYLVAQLLPILGIGILSFIVGMICWPILGAQGRYRLSTMVVCFASWFVTLPIAAIASIWLRINLQGQTAAIIAGYTIAGTLNIYFVVRSDWEALSESIIEANRSINNIFDSDSDSGSGSDYMDNDSSSCEDDCISTTSNVSATNKKISIDQTESIEVVLDG